MSEENPIPPQPDSQTPPPAPSAESSQVPPPPPPAQPQATPPFASFAPPVQGTLTAPTQDDKTMAMLCHLLSIAVGFLGPLVLWLIKKDQSPFVDDQGKEALNFQITVFIAALVSALSMFICIGFVLLPAVGIANLVFCIIGGIEANKGTLYRYPVCLRLIQ